METKASIFVEFSFLPTIYFAAQQNYVPVVRKLLINNNSQHDISNVEVEIIAESLFDRMLEIPCRNITWRILKNKKKPPLKSRAT